MEWVRNESQRAQWDTVFCPLAALLLGQEMQQNKAQVKFKSKRQTRGLTFPTHGCVTSGESLNCPELSLGHFTTHS